MVYLPAFSCFFYDTCKKKYHTQILWVSQLPIAPRSKTYPEFCGPKAGAGKKTRKTRIGSLPAALRVGPVAVEAERESGASVMMLGL